MINQQPDLMKICRTCHKPKLLSEFYAHPQARDGLHSQCNTCTQERHRTYKKVPRQVAGRSGEHLLIEHLKTFGIYATPGKCSEWRWVDVVAWGCVRIEVKHSTRRSDGSFDFKLGENVAKSDLIVFICDYNDRQTYHVFSSTHPVLLINGRFKTKMVYRPHTDHKAEKYVTIPNPMTDDLMESSKDKWELIEETRQSVSNRLMGSSVKPPVVIPVPIVKPHLAPRKPKHPTAYTLPLWKD